MMTKKEKLLRQLSRLQDSLYKEQTRLHNAIDRIGWGTGMRCIKCTPSFRREDEIKEKIDTIKNELNQIEKEEAKAQKEKHPFLHRIMKAIKEKRFSFENVMNKGVYYGKRCNILPLFCSYGCIGYSINTDEGNLSFDFELNKIEIEILS